MKNSIILSLMLVFGQLTCLAQNKFKPGKIIFKNNDTVSFYIDMKTWDSTPEIISYKTDLSLDKFDEAAPEDILGFILEGKAEYISASVRYDRSSDILGQLSYDKEPIWVNKTIFVQRLLNSEVSLYWYKGRNNQRFYYQKGPNQNLEPLVYKRYFPTPDRRSYQSNQNFKSQLWQRFKCGTTQKEIKNLEYNSKDLGTFFQKYNQCEGYQTNTDEAYRESVPLAISVIARAGIGIASGGFSDTENEWSGDFESSTATHFDLELEYSLSIKNPYTIALGVGYVGYNSTGVWKDLNFLNTSGTASVKRDRPWSADANFINITFTVRKYFMWKADQGIYFNASYLPIVSVGMNTGIEVKPATDVYDLDIRNTPVSVELKEQPHIGLGGGLTYKGLIFDIRYFNERDRLKNTKNYSSDYSSLNFSLGYRF